MTRLSSTVSSVSRVSCCGTTPIRARIRGPSRSGSSPSTDSSPPVTGDTQPIVRIVDVLPGPFGPRNPNASPGATSKSIESTAVNVPNRLVRFRARMSGGVAGSWPPIGGSASIVASCIWLESYPSQLKGPLPSEAVTALRGPRSGSASPRSEDSLDLLELALDGLVPGGTLGSALAADARRGAFIGRLGLPAPVRTVGAIRAIRAGGRGGLGGLVGRRPDPTERLGERLHAGADQGDVIALEGLAQAGDLRLDLRPVFGRNLVAEVAERSLGLVRELLRVIAGLDLLAPVAVLFGVGLGLGDHLVDVVLRQHRRGRDPNLLLLARRPVLGPNVEDAVRVDIECHLDLGDAAGRRRDAVEDESAERLVVGGEVALALEDVDLDLVLVVRRGREGLRLRCRDRRVPLDELGHDATERLDAERKRGNVEEEDVLDLATEDTGLDRGADRDDLIGVHAVVGLLAEARLHGLLDCRHAGHAADQDDLVDVPGLQAGVLESGLNGGLRLLDELLDQVLELRPGEGHHEVLRAGGVGRHVRQVDLGRHRRGQLDLRLLGGFLQTLERLRVLREVDPLVLLELGQQPLDDLLVEVVATEVRVAVGRLDLEDAVAQPENREA